MSEINEKWLSIDEISEYLGVTKDTIRTRLRRQIYHHINRKTLKS